MVAHRAAHSTGQTRRTQARGSSAGNRERRHVCSEHGMPMALCSQRPAAEKHAVWLFRPLELGWHAGSHSSRALCEVPGSHGSCSEPGGLRHRQPEREERGKRGDCIDRGGYDAGKKIKGKKRHILVDTLGLLLHAVVHPGDIQDRDGGVLVLSTLFGLYPFLQLTADIKGQSFKRLRPNFCRTSKSKSSNAPITPKGLSFCRDAGLSSAPSRGSIAVAAGWTVLPTLYDDGGFPAARWSGQP